MAGSRQKAECVLSLTLPVLTRPVLRLHQENGKTLNQSECILSCLKQLNS
jgi:hypothetical protein